MPQRRSKPRAAEGVASCRLSAAGFPLPVSRDAAVSQPAA